MEHQSRTGSIHNAPHSLHLRSFFVIVLLLVIAALFSACTSQTTGSTNTKSTPTTVAQDESSTLTVASPQSTTGHYPVKVYFSKVNATNYDDVTAVNRISPTLSVGTFAVEQVVAGPTQAEKDQGLFSQLHDSINGQSNCVGQNAVGGSDFLLTLNKKGNVNEQGTATLQFCRDINSPGVGSDARITIEISTTLKQFSSVKKVVILRKDGHCFGDESGL